MISEDDGKRRNVRISSILLALCGAILLSGCQTNETAKLSPKPGESLNIKKQASDETLQETFAGNPLKNSGVFGIWKRVSGAKNVHWDPIVGHQDKSSLRLGPGTQTVASEKVAVTPGSLLKANAWLKRKESTGDVKIEIEYFDKLGHQVFAISKYVPLNSGKSLNGERAVNQHRPVFRADNNLISYDWQLMQVRGWVPPKAAMARIRITRKGSVICTKKGENYLKRLNNYVKGDIWIDDVTLACISGSDVSGKFKDLKIPPSSLKPSDYVTPKGGNLYLNGEKCHFWSTPIKPALTNKDIDNQLKRLQLLGFNSIRTKLDFYFDLPTDYVLGDGSSQDRFDYMVATAHKHGIKIWHQSLNNCRISLKDVNVLNDPATAKDWREAMLQILERPKWPGGTECRIMFGGQVEPVIWDPRMKVKYHKHIRRVLNHRNKYNGLTYGEDPTFYNWELTNEEWWIFRILWGKHLSLPSFFQKGLYDQWNKWLKKRYGSDAALEKAWGKLIKGESLAKNTIMMVPLLRNNDTHKIALVIGLDVSFSKSQFKDIKFSKQRGNDVVHFLADMIVNFKNEAKTVFRSCGRKGLGNQIVPLTYDTGYAGSIISLYVQSFGDVTAMGIYNDMASHDPGAATFPFKHEMRRRGVHGFIDDRRVKDKVMAVYETMVFNPQKYRISYVYRMLAMLATQNGGIINWHSFGHFAEGVGSVKNPYGRRILNYVYEKSGGEWGGVLLNSDEVMLAALKVAGIIFKNGYLKPASHPVTATLGSNALWNMDIAQRYNVKGVPSCKMALQKGFQWSFDPARKDTVISGSSVLDKTLKIVRPTPQITYNLQKGQLEINSPQGRCIVGFIPKNYTLGDLQLEDIIVKNPNDMPHVIPEERFVAIGAAAEDNQALAQSKRIIVSAVSTSFNSGFKLDKEKLATDKRWSHGLAASIIDMGTTPVLVARVGVTLKADWLKGRKYRMIDFNENVIADGIVPGKTLRIPENKPVFLVEITQ